MQLTYKDFKVGQELICIKQDTEHYNGGEKDNERLILGGTYKIVDVDYHFHDKVAVKLIGPWYFHSEFVPIECFSDIAYIRDKKLKDLGI
jgi:hypothetical protein